MILVFDLRVPNLTNILNPKKKCPGKFLLYIYIYDSRQDFGTVHLIHFWKKKVPKKVLKTVPFFYKNQLFLWPFLIKNALIFWSKKGPFWDLFWSLLPGKNSLVVSILVKRLQKRSSIGTFLRSQKKLIFGIKRYRFKYLFRYLFCINFVSNELKKTYQSLAESHMNIPKPPERVTANSLH